MVPTKCWWVLMGVSRSSYMLLLIYLFELYSIYVIFMIIYAKLACMKKDMTYVEIGSAVADIREEMGVTQKEMAKRLKMHQSQISRLESGDSNADIGDYERYLHVLNSESALKFANILKMNWKHLSRPSPKHPNIDTLVEIEEALQRLQDFRQNQSMPHMLAGQTELLFKRLTEFGKFLLNLEHKIVYIGDIGVGKTTVACQQAGLVTDLATAANLKGMMLDTGGGRTTLCDAYVQHGNGFAIEVEPFPDEEIYQLVTELCKSIKETVGENVDYRPPEELERALRNMSGLTRSIRKRGEPPPVDPVVKINDETPDLKAFIAEVASKLTLWRRTHRKTEFEGSDEDEGRRWIKETFTAINNGRHADFSLPSKITITVPFSLISGIPFNITLIDTRGIDGSAIRPDLTDHVKDLRAVTMLCTKWGSAPDVSLQDFLKHIAETEVDTALRGRKSVLVLARAGEGLSMRHESGESVEEPDEGYEIKRDQVEEALNRIEIKGVDVMIFNSACDDSAELTSFLVSRIDALRTDRCASARATIHAVDEMLQNVQEAEALATLDRLNKELRIVAGRYKVLAEASEPACKRLLNAIHILHPRTIWATTRRAGEFWNFNIYQYLGDGATADAKRRCGPPIQGLREIIKTKLANPDFKSAHSFLEQLCDNVDAWESDFVKAVRHHAVVIYWKQLSSSETLWDECEDLYGRGIGYRKAVASKLESWFDDRGKLQEELDRRTEYAWTTSVLNPLLEAVCGPSV